MPGHGHDDFNAGVANDLPLDNPVDGRGVYVDGTELFAGMHIYEANKKIVEILVDAGKLLRVQQLEHSYPHCWRHKTPVIFRATPQWFISMDQNGLRDSSLNAIQGVQWIPDWGKQRIEGMVAGRPDWCISRQRTWGVPIPLFTHRETDAIHPDTPRLIEEIAAQMDEQGIEAWFALDARDLLGADAENYQKVTDTMDVWMDSGMVHHYMSNRRDEMESPADLYLEGSDQHRGWFQSSLKTSIAINGCAPYKQVLTHGFTVDEKGYKMSKSLGNVIAPQEVTDSLGGDILRLWVAATDYSGEMAVSKQILQRTADSYRRIRNTARFLLANLNGFNPETDMVKPEEMLSLDQWAVDRALQLQGELQDAYNEYHFLSIYQKVHNFCAQDLGGFYLDIIKDRQYTTQPDSLARRSCQTALYHIIEALVRWVAPILTFTAEEIYENIPGQREESVYLTTWYEGLFEMKADGDKNRDYWNRIADVKEAVNKALEDARNAGTVKGSIATEVTLFADAELKALIEGLGDELRFVLLTSDAQVADLADAGDAAETELAGLKVTVKASEHAKCGRCWHHREDVGQHAEHPELCGRCVTNLPDGEGEQRQFA